MEKGVVLKTEVQENGDIFLFYVDENGCPVQNHTVTTIDQHQLELLQENYVLEELPTEQSQVESTESIAVTEDVINEEDPPAEESNLARDKWLHEETEKVLIFFIDNKEAFLNPSMKNKHLWSVACKTMLVGKNPAACETKLRNLKRQYTLLHIDYIKNNNNPKVWPYYDICHQAFNDDKHVQKLIKQTTGEKTVITIPSTSRPEDNAVVVVNKNKSPDEKVKQMLELYLQYKKEGLNNYLWHKKVWEKIAIQIGEDAEFWHKRFLNYKQHYIRALEKRKECGAESIVWPYMALYDEIYGDDLDFKRKYGSPLPSQDPKTPVTVAPAEWNVTEKTVLVKYYFDCIGEFEDPSIPNGFLWNEVGRLLDKTPEECRNKYEQLKQDHLDRYAGEGYDMRTRKPVDILFDNIISQEVEKMYSGPSRQISAANTWKTEKIDAMVQFLFDKIEMFKDPICHFVCWAAVAAKIDDTVQSCKEQWNDLTTLYKSILNDKKEDPELQIDWRYIEIFDRIFDYGMDTKLLEGYEKKVQTQQKPKKILVSEKPEAITEEPLPENLSDLEPDEFEDKTAGKRARGVGDPKQIKILEYYLKYKDKFGTSQRKKQALWEALASTIGISAEQCAHRFRNLKQVYMAYIQREINKPDKPILWPYFALCKKAFGYRQIKNKLKQTSMDEGDMEEWTPREIKILISYFGQNMQDSDAGDASNWTSVAQDINKSKTACRDKFLDLRKSYRKIITMLGRNPNCKVNWKYFKFFDEIYSKAFIEGMEVDSADGSANVSYELPPGAVKTNLQDDDLQCIIVIPEGEETANTDSAQIIINGTSEPNLLPRTEIEQKKPWTKEDKIAFLKLYLQVIEERKGTLINHKKNLKQIADKIGRLPRSCKLVLLKIKARYKQLKEENKLNIIKRSAIYSLMDKIMSLKPKFAKETLTVDDFVLKEEVTYTDVVMPLWMVENALKYYLDHVEEFVSPKYDKKQAWVNLAKSVPLNAVHKIFRKINYLKQFFNSDTNEVDGEKFEFAELLQKILEKEFECKIAAGNIPEPMNIDEGTETVDWTDEETEELLQYYLTNLDKFKNPIYVPSYLWMEASNAVSKSAMACSKKMTEIRSLYSAMMKENPEALNSWRFYELCQKIYGTGKKSNDQE